MEVSFCSRARHRLHVYAGGLSRHHLDKRDLQSLYSICEAIVNRAKVKGIRSSLMNVGRRVDYAVRALSYLAGQPAGKIISRSDIEKSQDIPSFYLSKIMKDLVAGGLVQSHIGSKGGFTLAKGAEAISIKAPIIVPSARYARKNRFGKRRRSCLPNSSPAFRSRRLPIDKDSKGD